jgi:hypothetical protein
MNEHAKFTEDEADEIFSRGLELAKNGHEANAVEVWRPLARAGDISAIENMIYSLSILGKFDEALPWLSRFANLEYDNIENIALKLKVPARDLYWFIAENSNTSIEVLTKLSKNPNRNIRWAVAANSSTTLGIILDIAKYGLGVLFSSLGEFECVECNAAISSFDDAVWEEDSAGLCPNCATELSVDDIQCYKCLNRVVDANSPSKIEEYFDEKCNSGIISEEQFEYILDGFHTDGGQLIGYTDSATCLNCANDSD